MNILQCQARVEDLQPRLGLGGKRHAIPQCNQERRDRGKSLGLLFRLLQTGYVRFRAFAQRFDLGDEIARELKKIENESKQREFHMLWMAVDDAIGDNLNDQTE